MHLLGMHFRFFLIGLIALAAVASAADKPVVFVPIAPYATVAERIAGDTIELHTLVGPGDDPHSFSPSPRTVTKLSQSNVIFQSDLGFEGSFFVRSGDGTDAPLVVDLLAGMDRLEGTCAQCEEAKAAGKEPDHHHEEEILDPHVWLSPALLSQAAQTMTDSLLKVLPLEEHAGVKANLKAFQDECQAISDELAEKLAPLEGSAFYVYHAAFGYYARDFGLKQVALEEGNRSPTPKQLTALITQAKEDRARTIFVQPQFDTHSAKALAEAIDGKIQELDPLEPDVLGNLRVIADTLVAAHAGRG